MRRATILVAILAFTPLANATAQVRQPPVQRGARVRITVPSHRYMGTLVVWTADWLVVENQGDTLGVPLDSVTALEVSRGTGRSPKGAARGALIGGVVLGIVWRSLPVGAFGAGFGALLGSGPSARKRAGTGFLVGAAVGALIGLASYEECVPSCFGPDGPEINALGGAVIGGLGGLVVGALIGSATEADRWQEVPLDRLRVNLGPQRDGRFGFWASVRF